MFGAVPAYAADRFQVQVSAGYDGYARSDDWIPVQVTVKNNGGDFRGLLQLDDAAATQNSGSGGGFGGAKAMPAIGPYGVSAGGAPVGAATREVAVVIPAGSTRHYTLYVAAAQRPRVTLLSGTTAVASAEPTQPLTMTGPTTLLVAVVSDQADTLDQLALVRPSTNGTVHVTHFKPAALPASGVLLRTFDAVVIDDASTDAFTADQKGALQDYVQEGGGLLLVGGPSARKTMAGIPADLQPVKPAATRHNDLHVVGGLASSAAPAGGGEIATGELAAGARAVRDGTVPMLASLQVGRGTVVFTAFDPGAEPLASWAGEKVLLRQLVNRANAQQAVSTVNAKGSSAVGPGGRVSLDYGSVSAVLNNLPSLDIPQLGFVGWLLFGYAILVGPVNYLVLKRMRKRHLAWLTIPAAVAVSSTAVLLIGLSIKGVGTQVNQVRVVEVVPGSGRQYVVTYSGLVAAHRGDYTMTLADGTFVGSTPNLNYPTSDNRVTVQGDPPQAVLRGVTAYSIRTLASEGFTQGQGQVDAELHFKGTTAAGSTVAGTVANKTGHDFEDAVVVYRGQYQQLGILHAGQAATVSFGVGSSNNRNGGDVASVIYPGSNGANGGTAIDRQQQRRAQILRSLVGGGFGPGFDSGPPMLVAFTPGTLAEPIVDGRHVKVQGEAVVSMAIPLGTDTGATAVQAGDVVPSIVDVEGDLQSNYFGPGTAQIQVSGGSVTYELDLPGGGWTSAAVTASSNASAAGGCAVVKPVPIPVPLPGGAGITAVPAPTQGCNGAANIAVFNFQTDKWVDAKSDSAALHVNLDVGAGMISPDGVVLVRFTAPAGTSTLVVSPDITARRGASA
jgi:hypothetical protein